jgi:hypothetical protein
LIGARLERASLLFASAPVLMSESGTAVAADDEHIYWTNGNDIARANTDGTQPETLITGLNDVRALAVDAYHIYWADSGVNKIGRADLDGTHVIQNFVNDVVGATGVAVDAHHVYWTTVGGASIGRANLDGTGVEDSFIRGLADPRMIAVDSFPHPTTTTVHCEPSPLPLGELLSCTATVTDPAAPAPQGAVTFTATQPGTFVPAATCGLVPVGTVVSACAVVFRPSVPGLFTITGSYVGDVAHEASSAIEDAESVATSPPSPVSHIPSNRFTLGKPRLNRGNGTANQSVTVPASGRVALTGEGIQKHTMLLQRGGRFWFTLRPAKSTRRALTKKGSAHVAVTVTYVPSGGSARAKSEQLTLKTSRR